jgi:signal transduction histidine kinase
VTLVLHRLPAPQGLEVLDPHHEIAMSLARKTHYIENDLSEFTSSASLTAETQPMADHHDRHASGSRPWIAAWERLVTRPDLDFEETRKRRLFAILILPGIIILFAFGFYHLSHDTLAEGIFDLGAGAWLVFTLVCFRVIRDGINLYRVNAALLGGLFLFLSIKGGVHGIKIMWAFSFPLIAFYTLGKKEGLISTAVLCVLTIGVLYVHLDLVPVYAYAPEFKIRFCVAFFLVTAFTYIYESVREYSQTSLEGERNKLEAEKSKLAELSGALQRVNQALTLSEERLTRAQAIARVGNLEYGINQGMLWGSEEALRILGIDTPGAEFPFSILERIIPEFDVFRQEFEECMRNNQEYDRELTIHRLSDGQPVVLYIKAEIIRGAAGGAEKIISVIQDVSDQKQAEQDKRQLEDKLARSRKMESLGLLAGGVAHDLNNVLSGVVGYPDLILRNLPPESPLARPLKRIQESGQKAAAIVQDLLTLARRGVTNHRVLNLNDLVAEFMASPEHADIQNWHPDVTFDAHLDPELLNIKGSAVHLKKSIMNLFSNAAEALPAGGQVRIRTENRYIDETAQGPADVPEGDYVVFQVQDDGVGMSEEDLSRIFEPFYTKKKMGRSGTGLGMSVVWGTVQDHHGYIQIVSSEGVGTRIALYFPVTRESAVEPERVVPVEEYMGSGETILVVDDVNEQCELAHSMLSKLGYKVFMADGGEAALDLLASQHVDLMILDMIMDPGIDGLETYIRVLASHPAQRAIIVSGFSETDRVREAQRLGAEGYVKKPYTLEKLGVAVREALNR